MVELPVRWREIEGSKVRVVTAAVTMLRDMCCVRACYALGVFRI